jgi:protein TonB
VHRDLVATLVALFAHAVIAYGLLHIPVRHPIVRKVVEFDVRRPAPRPTPITPPPPKVEPPPPPRRLAVRVKPVISPPVATPPPNTTPKETPPEPPKPVFGVTTSSTTDSDSTFSVPVGNTTMIDPSRSAKGTGPVAPLPAAPIVPAKPEYKPVSELYVKEMPDIDAEACGRMAHYTAEAEQLGIEGEVKLRVALDEKGAVHDIKVLAGLGHGLDEEAVRTLRHRCKFKPAIGTDGKPVAFVISSYTFHFEVPR